MNELMENKKKPQLQTTIENQWSLNVFISGRLLGILFYLSVGGGYFESIEVGKS